MAIFYQYRYGGYLWGAWRLTVLAHWSLATTHLSLCTVPADGAFPILLHSPPLSISIFHRRRQPQQPHPNPLIHSVMPLIRWLHARVVRSIVIPARTTVAAVVTVIIINKRPYRAYYNATVGVYLSSRNDNLTGTPIALHWLKAARQLRCDLLLLIGERWRK